jgi:membrane carboxypeptidase/penicillin-binding protein PbpC
MSSVGIPPSRATLRIASPPDGATYLIDPTLRRDFQTLPLRASGNAGGAIEWKVDGTPVAREEAGATIDWPLLPGRHVFSARDAAGQQAQATIVVK